MRYLCIHGHFYQPPRENPWLEEIEVQDSAYPYHDWNERIAAECYGPNAAARILDGDRKIVRITNNYAKISFNFGPTLLSWAQAKAPELYRDILAGDRESRELFSGHGSAIAQAYNHMILPLASARDKRTQVAWGYADFVHRFGRQPEGMWLPETAVDLETLGILADFGLGFTILAPSQASRVRPLAESHKGHWTDVGGARIDPTRPYVCRLPGGKSIAIFFYDGPVSRAVAFEGLLHRGETFADRLRSIYNTRSGDQFAHIATDGESYGHHHRYGEMALAYALHHIESQGLARITNYGEYLESHPPAHEVEIFENTAWSCVHGVGRWSRDCGCRAGGPGWSQHWRGPLRAALDWLRDKVEIAYEQTMAGFTDDPWRARDDYIRVVLDRSPESRQAFLERHGIELRSQSRAVTLWRLLELQRHAMLMYTSCGWFFDELSGIETVQVIQYAGRVVQLAETLFGESLEAEFLERLALARSNLSEYSDGAWIYRNSVKPAMVNLAKVGAHFAISSLFETYPERASIYCYRAEVEDYRTLVAGKLKLAMGRGRFVSGITQDEREITFAAAHFGDHNLAAGIRESGDAEAYEQFSAGAHACFSRADVPEVVRLFDRGFGAHTYSLKSLFKDEQRRVLAKIMNSTLEEAEAVYRQVHEHHAPLMRFLQDLKTPLPRALSIASEYALNSRLRRAFSDDEPDLSTIRGIIGEARSGHVELDATTLEFTFRKNIERIALRLMRKPESLARLRLLDDVVTLARSLPFQVTLWIVQNLCYELSQQVFADMRTAAGESDEAREWAATFEHLAANLDIAVLPRLDSAVAPA